MHTIYIFVHIVSGVKQVTDSYFLVIMIVIIISKRVKKSKLKWTYTYFVMDYSNEETLCIIINM